MMMIADDGIRVPMIGVIHKRLDVPHNQNHKAKN
jgi:hypothetical protein